jgi:hypothetical protein
VSGAAADTPPPPGGAGAHRVTLTLVDPFPPEVEAGVSVVTRVRASCPAGCDLRGVPLRLESSGSCLAQAGLEPTEADGVEAALAWKAPGVVVGWTGAVVLSELPSPNQHGFRHEASLDVGCRVLPHATSLAVWSAGSPVRGSTFPVTVGAKCACGCSLAGQLVEIVDEDGEKVGEAKLEQAPRPGTSSLYAADLILAAPERTGVFSRWARFAGSGLELPHESAAATFTFRCLEPPRHTVTVRFAFEGIDPRRQGIEVRIGPYVAFTDESGVARVAVSEGAHELTFWRVDLEPVSKRVDVTEDTVVDVVAGPRVVIDEDAERYGGATARRLR